MHKGTQRQSEKQRDTLYTQSFIFILVETSHGAGAHKRIFSRKQTLFKSVWKVKTWLESLPSSTPRMAPGVQATRYIIETDFRASFFEQSWPVDGGPKEYLATCIRGMTFRSVVRWPLFCFYSTCEQKGKGILLLRTKKVLVRMLMRARMRGFFGFRQYIDRVFTLQ